MVTKADISLAEAIEAEATEHALLTLQYTLVMKRLVDAAKTDLAFNAMSWAPLAEMVNIAEFERVGTFKEVVRWPEYAELLTEWAKRADWQPRVRRVTEQDGVVFLELSESTKYAEMSDDIYSVSVYEFDAYKKLRRLDVYMQREQMPLPADTWAKQHN